MSNYLESHLKIRIVPEYMDVLKPYYEESIEKFNQQKSDIHRDSGFDLFIPQHFTNINYVDGVPIKIDHQVQCAVYDNNNNPLPYYLYPRSSISKTPFRLANQVGIIDSGYRGNIISKVDCLCGEAFDHGETNTIGMNYVDASDSSEDESLDKSPVNIQKPNYNVSNNLFIKTITANRVGRYSNFYEGQVGNRMFQICSHNLLPFSSVELVEDLDQTSRGEGGFGSTGGI
jgi:dUTPase